MMMVYRTKNGDDKYILITWYMDDLGDYSPIFETSFTYVSEGELGDIKALMREHRVERWVKDPEKVTEKNWKKGDGSIIEYRNIEIKPIKIVEAWSYSREKINGTS